MFLTDLPQEVLLRIVKESLPESFESLLLTCKKFYSIGEPFASNHNNLKRVWSDLHRENAQIYDINHLLLILANEPLIGRYSKNANLWARTAHTSNSFKAY